MLWLLMTFCALLITCALLVVQSAHPLYSVLYLILAYFNASALALLSGHDYMAVLLILLYVGAMCTFFLFTIMILDIQVVQEEQKRLKQVPVNAMVAIAFALLCKQLLHNNVSALLTVNHIIKPMSATLLDATTQIYSLGAVLYTTYAWHLIVASLILLAAMLGTIALTLNKSSYAKTQVLYAQNFTDYRRTMAKFSHA
jgi:NADH-quinone oxidoreductase subunit J